MRENNGPIPIPDVLTPYFEVFYSVFRPSLLDPNFQTATFWVSPKGKPLQSQAFSREFTAEVNSFNSFLITTPADTRRLVVTAAFESFSEENLDGESMARRIHDFERFLNVRRDIMERNYNRAEISIVYRQSQSFFIS